MYQQTAKMLHTLWKPPVLAAFLIMLVPSYTWWLFFKTRRKLREELARKRLHYQQHNCVVTYIGREKVTGWIRPLLSLNIKNLLEVYEPLLAFINSAKTSLDFAIMTLTAEPILAALLQAHKRGVHVRLLLDHNCNNLEKIRALQKEGIAVMYYVSTDHLKSSIMHYKYGVKDVSAESGYAWLGSMNCTDRAYRDYYEDVVFTMAPAIVRALHSNFKEVWCMLENINANNVYIKAKLLGVQ